MPRLYDRAFEILATEVKRCSKDVLAGDVQRDIVLKRLERLRSQTGEPLSYQELRETVIDFFPNFSEKVLKQAAKANCPPGAWSKIKFAAVFLAGSAGAIWVLNLPYPMIRWPVARTLPILLLPSYMSMDYNYRRAIASVEQADQLVNQATSSADLDLGAVKVKEAQKHLDALPVWFLGYWPKYAAWFGWQFTFDEFKAARANVGRMEAKLFQEKQAQTLLTQGEQALNTAKQQYEQASTVADREKAIAAWQAALDQINQLPQQTLIGRTSRTKLAAYQRDFQEVASIAAKSARTETLIEVAEQFAIAAGQKAQNPPHSASEWQEIQKLWSQAIDRLEAVRVEDSGYVEAQKLLAKYQSDVGTVRTRLEMEQASVRDLEMAKSQIESLLANTTRNASSVDRDRTLGQIQTIINQLENVKTGTTAYAEAQQLMRSAQNKVKEILQASPRTNFGN
ncbi:hypothetical protein [Argonema galeatum]|uniref:hypothetical protein n=1 Tax=Argonema galeatum TaxID=2942762 RepID=UPI0020110F72|nr:hypothetical protein [Argonema galeatum]MCL1468063.1 hypothetical protein [Argonema galeatum A003/A1]